MDIKAIRDALVARLETIPGTRVSVARDLINPPHLIVWGPEPIIYAEDFDAGHRLTFAIRLLLDRASERIAQDQLDGYLGDTGDLSVYAAVEADKTLGGTVMSAQVTSAQNIGNVDFGGVTYATVDLTVDVMT